MKSYKRFFIYGSLISLVGSALTLLPLFVAEPIVIRFSSIDLETPRIVIGDYPLSASDLTVIFTIIGAWFSIGAIVGYVSYLVSKRNK